MSGESLISTSSLSDDGITLRERSASLGESNERIGVSPEKNTLIDFTLMSEYTSMSFMGSLNHSLDVKLKTNDFKKKKKEPVTLRLI